MTRPSLTSPTITEVHRSPSIAARLTHVTDEVLVVSITFKARPDLGAPGLLETAAQAQGFSALDVLCARKFPFPRNEVMDALFCAHKVGKGYRRVILYGFSLGGYVSLNFANVIGAQVVIAASPLFSPDPKKVPFEQRWAKERQPLQSFPFDNIVEGLQSLDHAWLMYDPHDTDAHHIDAIASATPSVTLLPVRYGGHPVSQMLAQGRVLSDILGDIVHDRLDLAAFKRDVRASRRKSYRYFEALGQAQPQRRDALRVRLIEHALILRKADDPALLQQLIPPLLRLGRQAEAETAARTAIRAGADAATVEALLRGPEPEPAEAEAQAAEAVGALGEG